MRKAIPSLVMIATWTVGAAAQQTGGPPATSPGSSVSASSPNRQPGAMKIAGKLIANVRLPEPLSIRLEGQSAEQVAHAYVSEGGDFEFPELLLDPNLLYYVVVTVERFKPVRQTLNVGRETVFAPRIMIFLEPDVASSAGNARGGSVSAKQLTSKIPDKAIDEFKKARKESDKGNSSKAVEHLEVALKLAPEYYEAQNSLGVQYLLTQRFRDAEKAFERAQSLNPGADEPLINLGSLYYHEGQIQGDSGKPEAVATFQKAASFLQEAIRRNPRSPTAHQYLGAAFYKIGSYDQAESTLRRALELDSKLTDAEFMLLNVYTKQSRYAEALKQIDSFLKKNPKFEERSQLEKYRQRIEAVAKPER